MYVILLPALLPLLLDAAPVDPVADPVEPADGRLLPDVALSLPVPIRALASMNSSALPALALEPDPEPTELPARCTQPTTVTVPELLSR